MCEHGKFLYCYLSSAHTAFHAEQATGTFFLLRLPATFINIILFIQSHFGELD